MSYTTQVSYIGDGATKDYSVPFPYLDVDHVEVTVSGLVLPFAAYDWIGTQTIRLDTAPAVGAAVTIRRQTPLSQQIVQFKNGSVLAEEELNKSIQQILFVQQELTELYNGSLKAARVRLGNNLGIVTDPDSLMDELANILLQGDLMAEFQARWLDFDTAATAIIEEALRGVELKDGVNVLQDQVKIVDTRSEKSAAVLDLLAVVSNDGQSLILREDKVLRQGGLSLAQSFQNISADIDGARAYAQTLTEAIVGPSGAIAQLRNRLGVEDAQGAGFILDEQKVKLSAGGTMASRFTGLSAQFSGLDSRVSWTEASVLSAHSAIATETQARATAITTLTAMIGSGGDAPSQAVLTELMQVDAALGAKWGIATNANGHVAGIVLNNGGGSSSFVVAADRFAVVHPNGGSPIVPFEVEGGILKAPFIRAGEIYADSITTDNLKLGAVSTEKVAPNAVTNGAAAFSPSQAAVSPGGTVSVQAAGLSCSGGRVQIAFSAYVNPYTWPHQNNSLSQQTVIRFKVYRSGALIATFDGGVAIKINDGNYILPGGLQSFVMNDNPGTGFFTYEVQAETVMVSAAQTVTYQFSSRALNLLEIKR